jgi:hypothetical protein
MHGQSLSLLLRQGRALVRKVPFYEHGLFFDHFLPPLGLILSMPLNFMLLLINRAVKLNLDRLAAVTRVLHNGAGINYDKENVTGLGR